MTDRLAAADEDITCDAFLGGRFELLQPRKGLRAGSDAMFLAASVPAAENEAVFEAGVGTGAAALALLTRVTNTRLLGVECHAPHSELARRNAELNDMVGRLAVVEGDLLTFKHAAIAGCGFVTFDHAMANPPFYAEGRSRPGDTESRTSAHVMPEGGLADWTRRLAGLVRPGGTVSVIHRPESLPELLEAMCRSLGDVHILPFSPTEGQPATRILVQARKGSRAPCRLLAPFLLHHPDGGHTSDAEEILRGGGRLDLAGRARGSSRGR